MRFLHVAHIGADHTHYPDFIRYTHGSPYCKVEGVWDKDPEKAKRWAAIAGTRVFETYQAILEDPTIDAVVITSNPFMHEEHVIAAANAGKHVYVEQPLAISPEAAENIRAAVKRAGIHFAMGNPVLWADRVFAKKLMDAGLLGDILQMRYRALHDNSILYQKGEFPDFGYVYNKSLSGGGALNNMGCHGVKILHWFLGMPVSACGLFSSYTDIARENGIEENAIVVYKFKNGAIGSIETGWVHPRYQQNAGFEVHGTRGSVVKQVDGLYYRLSEPDTGWVKVPDKMLPAPIPQTMAYWIDRVYNDLPDEEYDIDEAVDLTKMICAAYSSQGKEILLGE